MEGFFDLEAYVFPVLVYLGLWVGRTDGRGRTWTDGTDGTDVDGRGRTGRMEKRGSNLAAELEDWRFAGHRVNGIQIPLTLRHIFAAPG